MTQTAHGRDISDDAAADDVERGDVASGDVASGDVASGDVESGDVESGGVEDLGDWSFLVTEHMGLAKRLARRYAGRGEPFDDLVQVACLGLVQAARRFDPNVGSSFTSFAIPTILGELRRHFRDRGWTMSVPRPVRDLHVAIQRSTDQLAGVLGRSPTVRELSDELDVSPEQIIEAQESGAAYRPLSLDGPVGRSDDDSTPSLVETMGSDDARYAFIEEREAVNGLLPQVPERERRMLYLRYYRDWTQAQIGRELGMSQMHVSRLLDQTVSKLKEAVLNDQTVIDWPAPRSRSHSQRQPQEHLKAS